MLNVNLALGVYVCYVRKLVYTNRVMLIFVMGVVTVQVRPCASLELSHYVVDHR